MKIRQLPLRLAAVAVFIGTSLFLAGIFPELPLFITDNGNKYIIMRDLAETGTFAIDHAAPEFFPCGGFHFQRSAGGEILSFHSWVLPALSALFYKLAGESAALLPVWLSGVFLLLLMTKSRKERFAAWALLLTAPFWLYSLMLWEMIPAALAATGAFILLKQRRFITAGIIFALGIWFREELYILGGIAGVLLLTQRRWRDALKLACGAAAALLPLWVINFSIYGHILGLHGATYALNNRPEDFSWAAELQGLVFNCYQHLLRFETLPPGISLIAALAGAGALLIPGLLKDLRIKTAGLIIYLLIDLVFIRYFFSGALSLFSCALTAGLLFSLPLAAGFFINLRQLLNDPAAHWRFTARAVLIYIVIVPLLLTRFDIGLTFGARHYICIMPLLMLLSFRGFAGMKLAKPLKQLILILLTAAGIVLQFRGFQMLYHSSWGSVELEARLAASEENVIISDLFFFPEIAPRSFFDKTCLEVTSAETLTGVENFLTANCHEQFILILGKEFRRMDNATLAKLLTHYRVTAPPQEMEVLPGIKIFIAHCRKSGQ